MLEWLEHQNYDPDYWRPLLDKWLQTYQILVASVSFGLLLLGVVYLRMVIDGTWTRKGTVFFMILLFLIGFSGLVATVYEMR